MKKRDARQAVTLPALGGTVAGHAVRDYRVGHRQRVVLSAAERRLFDTDFSMVLRRAVGQMLD